MAFFCFLVQFCAADWSLYQNEICYKHLAAGSKSFDNAQSDCATDGGNLPSFHSQQDWDDFLMHKYANLLGTIPLVVGRTKIAWGSKISGGEQPLYPKF